MISHLVYVTSNDLKLKNARTALKKYGIEVEQVKIDVPEIQSNDVIQVADFSARYAGELLNTTLIKTDVAFEIRALNGFPGPFIKYINQWLPPEKILQLMESEIDRYAQFVDCISLYQPKCGCLSFSATTSGQISEYARGEKGWGIDKIFVPDGNSETLASLSDKQRKGVWNLSHWKKLGMYLQNA